jgi:VanZ family protein
MVINCYKGVALVSLFDCIATLAEVLQEYLRTKEIADLIFPLLS